jgi:hypothetical protein
MSTKSGREGAGGFWFSIDPVVRLVVRIFFCWRLVGVVLMIYFVSDGRMAHRGVW